MGSSSATVFLSYSHQDKPLAHALAKSLQAAGLQVWVDDNELLPGDSIIEQVATAVADVDFFCPLVSENSQGSRWCQKELSLAMTSGLGREGATILPVRVGQVEMPPAIRDLLYVELDPDDLGPAVDRLSDGVRRHRDRRIHSGERAVTNRSGRLLTSTAPSASTVAPSSAEPEEAEEFQPISIVGVVREGVGQPRNDNTRGSALYRVPFRLSRRPPLIWAQLFPEVWNRPPSFTTMHRPGIASVQGDTIVLDGTTMEELEQYHAQTLRLVVEEVNRRAAEADRRHRTEQEAQRRLRTSQAQTVDEIANRLQF